MIWKLQNRFLLNLIYCFGLIYEGILPEILSDNGWQKGHSSSARIYSYLPSGSDEIFALQSHDHDQISFLVTLDNLNESLSINILLC